MARSSPIAPRDRARIWRWHQDGESARGISRRLEAEGKSASHPHIIKLLRQMAEGQALAASRKGDEPAAPTPQPEPQRLVQVPPSARKRGRPVEVPDPPESGGGIDALLDAMPSPTGLEAGDVAGALADLDSEIGDLPALPEEASPAARVIWQDLVSIRQVSRMLLPLVLAGTVKATELAGLKRVALAQMRELHDMLPKPPPDPAKDPVNASARAMVHAHVLRTIEAVEARAGLVCPRCRERSIA
jgi:hypothetical protein